MDGGRAGCASHCRGMRWGGGSWGEGSSLPLNAGLQHLCLPRLPGCCTPGRRGQEGARGWYSPGSRQGTGCDKDAPARKEQGGGPRRDSDRWQSGRVPGLAPWGVPLAADRLRPPVPQFPRRLQRGRELAWLPAWPPSLEFLLCACCARRKVLWESKYSSPRRLRAGCSLSPAAGEGHRERGCTAAGERRGPTAPGMLRIPPPLHPRLRPGALRAGQTPESGGDPRAPAERGARSSRRGSGACCRARELAAGAAGLACGGEGRREEHSSHI